MLTPCVVAASEMWNRGNKGVEGAAEEVPRPRGFDFLLLNQREKERLEEVEDKFGNVKGEEYTVVGLRRIFEGMSEFGGGGQ